MYRIAYVLRMIVAALAVCSCSGTSISTPKVEKPEQPLLVEPESYTVEQREDGTLRIYVDMEIDWRNRDSLDEFAAQKRSQTASLLEEDADIALQITFAEPVDGDSVRKILAQSRLTPTHVTLETRDEQNRLGFMGSTTDDGIIPDFSHFGDGSQTGGLRVEGVMVIDGVVPARGLQLLLDDPRIYLLNTAPYLLKRELSKEYEVDPSFVQVAVQSPHWTLSESRVE